jgi:hypothetical protein
LRQKAQRPSELLANCELYLNGYRLSSSSAGRWIVGDLAAGEWADHHGGRRKSRVLSQTKAFADNA